MERLQGRRLYDSESHARLCAQVVAQETKGIVYVWKIGNAQSWIVENGYGYPPGHWRLVDAVLPPVLPQPMVDRIMVDVNPSPTTTSIASATSGVAGENGGVL
jgi:hypothetical protein